MALDPVTALLNIGSTVIDRILPDKTQAATAKAELLKMQLAGEIQAQIDQIEVDKVEAASNNWFVAGWRPAVGWACTAGFVYSTILQPLIQFVAVLCHSSFDMNKLPHMDTATTVSLLLALLGMGAYRSYDKAQGTGNGH